jgi:Flp pilus assembly protein TadD
MAQSDNINGVALYQQGNYQGAVNQFTQAVDSDPNDADAYYNLGATYHQLGKMAHNQAELQQAESYYHQCLDRNPDQRDCYRGLAVLLVEEGRGTDAFSLMQRWAEHSPSSPAPRVELARLYEEYGDKKSAEANLQEALAIAPTDPRALAALGRMKEQEGDRAQALAIYQRSLQANQFQPQLEARVAALQTGGVGTIGPTPPDGTRIVTAPAAPLR